MDEAAARHVAQEVSDRMAAHWGGQNLYFPMGLPVLPHTTTRCTG
ncbi:Mor transcription activator family protein [Pseudomonas sp.]